MNDEQEIRREAARWLATLRSGQTDSATEADFIRWQTADVRHAEAMAQLYKHLGSIQRSPLNSINVEHLAGALNAKPRRRFIRGALAIAVVGSVGLVASRFGSTGFALPGDLYTGIGERRTYALADWATLTLNASTRVSPGQRKLRLQQGEILLSRQSVGPKAVLTIETDFCLIHGCTKSVLVRQDSVSCFVLALNTSLDIEDAEGSHYGLSPRQWMRIDQKGVIEQGVANGSEMAWMHGLLTVENRTLGEVVEQLRSYHRGVLSLDENIAQLRISGTFPLDETEHALEMLATALPIRVVGRTSYWMSIQSGS